VFLVLRVLYFWNETTRINLQLYVNIVIVVTSGFHGSAYENDRFLGYSTVYIFEVDQGWGTCGLKATCGLLGP
jgi:hypothetical protein